MFQRCCGGSVTLACLVRPWLSRCSKTSFRFSSSTSGSSTSSLPRFTTGSSLSCRPSFTSFEARSSLSYCSFLSKWLTFSSLFPSGQKKNVLRNRIDSCDYDVEQLLLGTILFTFLSLLVPTVMVYYVLFSGVRHSFCHLCDSSLRFLTSFPFLCRSFGCTRCSFRGPCSLSWRS